MGSERPTKKMMFSLSKNPEIVENVFSLGDGC